MKFVLPIAFSMIVMGSAAYAQDPQQRPPQQQQQSQSGDSATITGCLSKGQNTGEYTIKDSTSGETYTFNGPDRLDSYVNHTVSLTGKMMTGGTGEKSFQPQSIKTVSDSCTGSFR